MTKYLILFFVLAFFGTAGYIVYIRYRIGEIKKSLAISNEVLAQSRKRKEALETARVEAEKKTREDEEAIPATIDDALPRLREAFPGIKTGSL